MKPGPFACIARLGLIELRNRFNGRCFYCDRMTVLPPRRPGSRLTKTAATRDHIIPKIAGGSDQISNLVLACNECNNERGSMPVDVFLKRKRLRESVS